MIQARDFEEVRFNPPHHYVICDAVQRGVFVWDRGGDGVDAPITIVGMCGVAPVVVVAAGLRV